MRDKGTASNDVRKETTCGIENIIKKQKYVYRSPSLSLSIPITAKLAVITGDSGTGKTLFATDIKTAKELGKQNEVKTNCDLSNTVVLLDEDDYTKFDYNTHKKLIILDKADPYVDANMAEFIKRSDNLFIIMSRAHNKYLGKLKVRFENLIELKGQQKNGVITITGFPAI